MRLLRRLGPLFAPLPALVLLTWFVASAGGVEASSIRGPSEPAALRGRSIPPIVLADHHTIGPKLSSEQRHPWPVPPAARRIEPGLRVAPAAGGPTPGIASGWFVADLAGRGPPIPIVARA